MEKKKEMKKKERKKKKEKNIARTELRWGNPKKNNKRHTFIQDTAMRRKGKWQSSGRMNQ